MSPKTRQREGTRETKSIIVVHKYGVKCEFIENLLPESGETERQGWKGLLLNMKHLSEKQ